MLIVYFVQLGFNPCCFGSLVRAYVRLGRERPTDLVSILVVLDHWFGLLAYRLSRGHVSVSILVVLDHWFGPTMAHRSKMGR